MSPVTVAADFLICSVDLLTHVMPSLNFPSKISFWLSLNLLLCAIIHYVSVYLRVRDRNTETKGLNYHRPFREWRKD